MSYCSITVKIIVFVCVCVCVCVCKREREREREREVYDTVDSKTFTFKNDIMHQLKMFILLKSFSRCYFLPQSEIGNDRAGFGLILA